MIDTFFFTSLPLLWFEFTKINLLKLFFDLVDVWEHQLFVLLLEIANTQAKVPLFWVRIFKSYILYEWPKNSGYLFSIVLFISHCLHIFGFLASIFVFFFNFLNLFCVLNEISLPSLYQQWQKCCRSIIVMITLNSGLWSNQDLSPAETHHSNSICSPLSRIPFKD